MPVTTSPTPRQLSKQRCRSCTRRSLLEATCTRQTSSSSSGRTLRMCGSLTGASYDARSPAAADRRHPGITQEVAANENQRGGVFLEHGARAHPHSRPLHEKPFQERVIADSNESLDAVIILQFRQRGEERVHAGRLAGDV